MSDNYHKIKTIWDRDPDTHYKTLIANQWATPEFEFLAHNQWTMEEKVDGTNIRITIGPGQHYEIGGRTDNAQIYAPLYEVLKGVAERAIAEEIVEDVSLTWTMYGEGYGAKIQKGGGNYNPDGVDFALFDVRIGNVWLRRVSTEQIAGRIGVRKPPVLAIGTLAQAVHMVKCGVLSSWGDFEAEGLILRPVQELRTRRGDRIIGKIKIKDFPETTDERKAQ